MSFLSGEPMPVIASLKESFRSSANTFLQSQCGATGEIRTPGLLITNQTLYQSKLQWQRRATWEIRIRESVY